MSSSLETLALNAALENNWEKAVEINQKILEEDPSNIEALGRLGRAYRAFGRPAKAADVFRRTLKIDPLNALAQKNLEELKDGTKLKSSDKNHNGENGSFIIEPGTTQKVNAHLDSRRINPKKLIPGQKFVLEIKGDQVVVKDDKNKIVGMVCEDNCSDFLVARKIYHLKELEATYLHISKGPWVEMLARAAKPIFKASKQDINPEAKFVADEESAAE